MAVTVPMPQLGESVTEGTITQWLKQPGDAVERYESIAEVTTDKVNAEIPSPVAGTMGGHLVAEGTVVPLGGAICRMESDDAGAEEGLEVAAGEAAGDVVAAAPPPSVQREAPVAASAGSALGRAGGARWVTPRRAPPPPGPQHPVAGSAPSATEKNPSAAAPAGATGMHLTPAVRMLASEHA